MTSSLERRLDKLGLIYQRLRSILSRVTRASYMEARSRKARPTRGARVLRKVDARSRDVVAVGKRGVQVRGAVDGGGLTGAASNER
jgi:hypothetical protein